MAEQIQLCLIICGAGQAQAMNKYMPVMSAVRAGASSAEGNTPQSSQLKKRMGPHGKSAFKQTTLMFGKKPKTTAASSLGKAEVINLSDI